MSIPKEAIKDRGLLGESNRVPRTRLPPTSGCVWGGAVLPSNLLVWMSMGTCW